MPTALDSARLISWFLFRRRLAFLLAHFRNKEIPSHGRVIARSCNVDVGGPVGGEVGTVDGGPVGGEVGSAVGGPVGGEVGAVVGGPVGGEVGWPVGTEIPAPAGPKRLQG